MFPRPGRVLRALGERWLSVDTIGRNNGVQSSNSAALRPQHLRIQGLPRTALNSDIKRMLDNAGVKNVKFIQRQYIHFRPQDHAFVTFTHPDAVNDALSLLRSCTISGVVLTLTPWYQLPGRTRLRGSRGRQEAAERGLIVGNGLEAGVRERGKAVVLIGLPSSITKDEIRRYLVGFKLAEQDDSAIVNTISGSRPCARYLVRLQSVSEAHRLVRQFHMRPFGVDGDVIHARVLY